MADPYLQESSTVDAWLLQQIIDSPSVPLPGWTAQHAGDGQYPEDWIDADTDQGSAQLTVADTASNPGMLTSLSSQSQSSGGKWETHPDEWPAVLHQNPYADLSSTSEIPGSVGDQLQSFGGEWQPQTGSWPVQVYPDPHRGSLAA
ncbi:uncharacterized protein EMH_0086210 [Eimeria mitis]|uniref:Uncharacterized protein n=1 Tax=Eimeria mitis TaxID=44415 RepID=U6KAT7_9EIME|nr:uncharacterized protein EMH_0086210 [Eimeria mitis]CDJ33896.1 hypothetical protein, conserved [Eimeria mitis]